MSTAIPLSDDGQALAAFRASSGKDLAAALGGHSGTESIFAGTFDDGRLISSFHGFTLFPKLCDTPAVPLRGLRLVVFVRFAHSVILLI